MTQVDAHHHAWRLDRGGYGWLTPDLAIHRGCGLDDLRPLLGDIGADRLMWGSDCPVVDLAGGFQRWRVASLVLLRDLPAHDQATIPGGSAFAFYGLA